MVNEPGQKWAINCRAAAGISAAYCSTIATEFTWTIKGLSLGRPLAWYTFFTAASFVASAPRPYTVSVGKATSSPARSVAAAVVISSGEKICVFKMPLTSFLIFYSLFTKVHPNHPHPIGHVMLGLNLAIRDCPVEQVLNALLLLIPRLTKEDPTRYQMFW